MTWFGVPKPFDRRCPKCGKEIDTPAMLYGADWSEITPGEGLTLYCPDPDCNARLEYDEWWEILARGKMA